MTTERLKCFVTLAEHLHFGRAADVLYISQSTLSYNIAQLEEELHTPLFIRNNRKVILSPVGVKLLPLAKEILETASQMDILATQANEESKGIVNLNICLDKAFSRMNLVGLDTALQELRAQNPSLRINVVLHELDTLLRETENMTQDIGFGYLRNDEKTSDLINVLPLYEDEMVLVHNLPNVEGMSPEELLNENTLYLLDHDPRWTDYFYNYVCNIGIRPKLELMDTFNDMYTFVRLGCGVTMSNLTDTGVVNGANDEDFKAMRFTGKGVKMNLCAFWAKGNYNYAIMELISRLNVDPALSERFW